MSEPEPKSTTPPYSSGPKARIGYGAYGSGYGYRSGYGFLPGQGNYGYGYPQGGGYGSHNQPSADKNVSIFTYIAMVRERIWWLVFSVLVFVTLSLIFTYNTIPEYKATGRLRVFRTAPNISAAALGIESNFNIGTGDDFGTAIETMRSGVIIESVSRQMTTAEKKEVLTPYQDGNIFTGPLSEQEVFARQRSISPQRSSLIVLVEFTHPNRELARQIATMFCRAIQKNSEDERLTVTNPLIEKYRMDIEVIEDRLRKLYDKRNELIKSQKLLSIAKDTNTLTFERGALVKSREDAQKMIDELEIIWRLVLDYKKTGKNPYDIAQVRADERVANLGNKIADLKLAISSMETKYTDEHPTLIQARAQLTQAEADLQVSVANSVNRIQASIQNAKASYDAIVANLERKDEEISRLQVANIELERIDKDVRGQEEFLSRQKQSFEEAKLRSSTTGTSTSIKILDYPSVSDRPVNKNYYVNAIIGLGLGVAVGIGVIVLLGSFDDRLKSPKDVEFNLGLYILGTIPRVDKSVGPDRALLGRHDKDLIAAEAIRSIYSAMRVNPNSMRSRVFLVTSTRPGEGKTFVATNLALCFAQHGEKVLVIDSDLRLPNVGPSLGFAEPNGISRWFNDECTLDEAIVRDVAPGMDVLPVGMSCRNPTQVINNPKYIDMLVDMRSRYDRIFIDSPPIGPVSDSLNLIPYVDGVIYVVRYNSVSTRNASECILRLREVGVPIIGAVLNCMSLRLASIYTDSFDASYEKYYQAAKEASTQPINLSDARQKIAEKSDDSPRVS